jgi:hypothetical protein
LVVQTHNGNPQLLLAVSNDQQVMALADDLDKLIERYRVEFDLNFASVVGVLEAKKWFLIREAEKLKDQL